MSYQTYTTEAIVCGSYDRLTADRNYLLFTETAGMVFAAARSAREERSKQRYALQDFTHIRVSLVKGRSGWRIGSVESIANYYLGATDRGVRGTVVGVVQFLRRLLTGEEANQAVFADTVAFLSHTNTLASARLATAYDIYQLRTLAHLGYVASNNTYASFLQPGTQWLEQSMDQPVQANKAIEHGLNASQL